MSLSLRVPAPSSGHILTFQEAMAYLRVSRSTLYRLMWSGQLRGHKVGSTWQFYTADLEATIRCADIAREAENGQERG